MAAAGARKFSRWLSVSRGPMAIDPDQGFPRQLYRDVPTIL
jgi:hypothetical protein